MESMYQNMLPDNPELTKCPRPSEPVLTCKEMAPDMQPRERLLKYGVASLSNAELFAIILRTGIRGYPITELCRDLMKLNGDMFLNLERRSREEIMSVSGIGELKAMQIEAVMEIVRRYMRESMGNRLQIKSSQDIYDAMRCHIANLPHEEIWAIFLDQGHKVLAYERSSEGGHAASVFDCKKILRRAILARAQAIIMCHNHPSGTLRPSPQDDQITRRLNEACRVMDLRLLDHLIITTEGYYSYRDNSSILG